MCNWHPTLEFQPSALNEDGLRIYSHIYLAAICVPMIRVPRFKRGGKKLKKQKQKSCSREGPFKVWFSLMNSQCGGNEMAFLSKASLIAKILIAKSGAATILFTNRSASSPRKRWPWKPGHAYNV
ncbi:hypothetical protein NPIL_104791 [Nephila pilipes]|uniref:Uncharacterized protein n=1 Tax=Nephila pilipes TaxID=299642 RepID=A0A8X6QZY9_NEPPI|nr:hypothetical protein NPIL_104791 [Nephila pilipes]